MLTALKIGSGLRLFDEYRKIYPLQYRSQKNSNSHFPIQFLFQEYQQ